MDAKMLDEIVREFGEGAYAPVDYSVIAALKEYRYLLAAVESGDEIVRDLGRTHMMLNNAGQHLHAENVERAAAALVAERVAREDAEKELAWRRSQDAERQSAFFAMQDAKEKAEAERDSLKQHAEAMRDCLQVMIDSDIGRLWNWPSTAHESALQRMKEAVDAYRAAHKEKP